MASRKRAPKAADVSEVLAEFREHYEARDGRRISNKEAVILGGIFMKIHSKYGTITAAIVVDEARNKRSFLHKFFEWDNRKAGEQYRISQARRLIGSVSVVIESDHVPARKIQAFVSIERATGKGYSPTLQVMQHATYREQVLSRALRDLSAWRFRYKHIQELATLFEAMDMATKQVRVENQPSL